jgi:3,8-divinyl chlorophyllide a/chlorophyllide a reductase subunit X
MRSPIAPPVRPAPDAGRPSEPVRRRDDGADFVLTPATDADMRGKNAVTKKSLEVVYDNA